MHILPASAIIPTRNRVGSLRETLNSLEKQEILPAELIVVDASSDAATREMIEGFSSRISPACALRWMPADVCGAATQRNQGVLGATHSVIWFFDDDILFEPECVSRLWKALHSDTRLGGVNTMIVNQSYHSPGHASRSVFRLLHGHSEVTYAGLVLGPAVNLLPEDRDDLPEVVRVQWLNTTCTLYRREALPRPPFDQIFRGYSLMEDLTLSLRVGRRWRLANARTARIFHDSQPGPHKSDPKAMATMELVNRHYVMTEVLGRRRFLDYLRLFEWETFQLTVCALRSQTRPQLLEICSGKLHGLTHILRKSFV